jgi:hypothetical protein
VLAVELALVLIKRKGNLQQRGRRAALAGMPADAMPAPRPAVATQPQDIP